MHIRLFWRVLGNATGKSPSSRYIFSRVLQILTPIFETCVRAYTRTRTRTRTCMGTHTHAHTQTYMRAHTHTREKHTHMHTHAQTHASYLCCLTMMHNHVLGLIVFGLVTYLNVITMAKRTKYLRTWLGVMRDVPSYTHVTLITARHWNTLSLWSLQDIGIHCNTQPTSAHFNALQRTAMHCNPLQRTATPATHFHAL